MPTRWELFWAALSLSPYFKIHVAILCLMGLWFLIELLIIGTRYRRGETLWSSIAKWDERRRFRQQPVMVEPEPEPAPELEPEPEPVTEPAYEPATIPHEATIEIIHTPVRSLAPVEQVSDAPPAPPSPPASPAPPAPPAPTPPAPPDTPIQQAPSTMSASRARFDLEGTTDKIEIMFKVKSGFIKVLWEQRAMEEQAGNVDGVRAIDVLIADVESQEVQKVWVLGDARMRMSS